MVYMPLGEVAHNHLSIIFFKSFLIRLLVPRELDFWIRTKRKLGDAKTQYFPPGRGRLPGIREKS